MTTTVQTPSPHPAQKGEPVTPKTAKQLDFVISQFPVSSGKSHATKNESWLPILTSTTHLEKRSVSFLASPLNQISINSNHFQPPSKFVPGQFSGISEVQRLSYHDLASGPSAYARKRQLIEAPPITNGPGKEILEKYGWEPGNGLGRYRRGLLEPYQLEVKLDKRGLGAGEKDEEENPSKRIKLEELPAISWEDRNSISVLYELCGKRKWDVPSFQVHSETGRPHKKIFVFKVIFQEF